MESEWMGRYREIVAAIVLHGNVVICTQTDTNDIGDGIYLRHQQWQILEYIVENRERIFSMADISYRLNIPQSTFSKTVKLLCEHNLVGKYQAVNNRKILFCDLLTEDCNFISPILNLLCVTDFKAFSMC